MQQHFPLYLVDFRRKLDIHITSHFRIEIFTQVMSGGIIEISPQHVPYVAPFIMTKSVRWDRYSVEIKLHKSARSREGYSLIAPHRVSVYTCRWLFVTSHRSRSLPCSMFVCFFFNNGTIKCFVVDEFFFRSVKL